MEAIASLQKLVQQAQVKPGQPQPPQAGAPIVAAGDMGQQIVKFVKDNFGKKVGTGECADLANHALQSVGAKTSADYGVSGPDKDYIWGKLVTRYEDVQPGDVIQFRNVQTVTKIVTGTQTRTITGVYAHHTAIVTENLGAGKFKGLQQATSKKLVHDFEINMGDKTQGEIWIYRPEKK